MKGIAFKDIKVGDFIIVVEPEMAERIIIEIKNNILIYLKTPSSISHYLTKEELEKRTDEEVFVTNREFHPEYFL